MAWYRKNEQVDYATFDENEKYTPNQLDLYAEALLKEDIRENGNGYRILLRDRLNDRSRKEVPVDATKIDGTITELLSRTDRPVNASGDGQKIYNRSHPKGRKVNSREQRARNGASYYR